MGPDLRVTGVKLDYPGRSVNSAGDAASPLVLSGYGVNPHHREDS